MKAPGMRCIEWWYPVIMVLRALPVLEQSEDELQVRVAEGGVQAHQLAQRQQRRRAQRGADIAQAPAQAISPSSSCDCCRNILHVMQGLPCPTALKSLSCGGSTSFFRLQSCLYDPSAKPEGKLETLERHTAWTGSTQRMLAGITLTAGGKKQPQGARIGQPDCCAPESLPRWRP